MSLRDISPAEIYVLNVIYELGQADIYAILDRIAPEKKWKYTTILTLATRLFDKGHLNRVKDSKRYVYTPKYSRVESFGLIMDRLFGSTLLNDPSMIIKYAIEKTKMNKKNQKALRELLAKM